MESSESQEAKTDGGDTNEMISVVDWRSLVLRSLVVGVVIVAVGTLAVFILYVPIGIFATYCILLTVLYALQLFFVIMKHQETKLDSDCANYWSKLPYGDKWTFFLVTLILPLGISLSSDILPQDGALWSQVSEPSQQLELLESLPDTTSVFGSVPGDIEVNEGVPLWRLHSVAYWTSKTIFILMITLEISTLYALAEDYWRRLLQGAMILDFIAFFGFTLQPVRMVVDSGVVGSREGLVAIAMIGLLSLLSSATTLYLARAYDNAKQLGSTD